MNTTTTTDLFPATPRRIYLVRNTETAEERLVRAANPAQARSHAARAVFEVSVAAQEQLVALLTGERPVKVEDASQQSGGSD